MKTLTYVIEKEQADIRLDKAISLINTDISRALIQKLIDDEKIKVNKKVEKASYKVKINDIIELEIDSPKEVSLKAEDIPLDIIYEDKDIVIVNKAKGMVVHPGNGNPDGTLVNAIMAKCKDSLSGIGGELRPGIVHRIDKDTSGLVIIAKNDKAHIDISNQIKEHKVKKTYIALVRGILKENEATINMPIGRSDKDRTKMAVKRSGKEAITHIKVIKRFNQYTLLEINIETGRTHQIRVHMAEIGYPIVGDFVYSNGKNPFDVVGQMLHAQKLEFVHPTTKERVKFEAPLPKYFEDILKKL